MRTLVVGLGWLIGMVGMRMIRADDDESHFLGFFVCLHNILRSDIVSVSPLDLGLPRVGNRMQRFDDSLVPIQPEEETDPFFGVRLLEVLVDFGEQIFRNCDHNELNREFTPILAKGKRLA